MESKFAPKLNQPILKKDPQESESLDFGKNKFLVTKEPQREEYPEYVAVEGKSFDVMDSLDENSIKVESNRRVIKPIKKCIRSSTNSEGASRICFSSSVNYNKKKSYKNNNSSNNTPVRSNNVKIRKEKEDKI